jgi:AcrR family transcriptional regulator
MPLPRFAKMPSEKRERLLTIAAQEFAAYGFEAASLNRILDVAKIAKSSVYYYFDDKADLFCAAIDFCITRLHLAPNKTEIDSLTIETFWITLAEIHYRALMHSREQPWLLGTVQAVDQLAPESLKSERLANLVQDMTQYMMTGIGTMIEHGQDLGLIRRDLPNELLISWFKAIDGASDKWILTHIGELDEETIQYISHQTIAAIQEAFAKPHV